MQSDAVGDYTKPKAMRRLGCGYCRTKRSLAMRLPPCAIALLPPPAAHLADEPEQVEQRALPQQLRRRALRVARRRRQHERQQHAAVDFIRRQCRRLEERALGVGEVRWRRQRRLHQ